MPVIQKNIGHAFEAKSSSSEHSRQFKETINGCNDTKLKITAQKCKKYNRISRLYTVTRMMNKEVDQEIKEMLSKENQ